MSSPLLALDALISALSPQEKRYIKLYLTRQEKEESHLLHLYELCLENEDDKLKKNRKLGTPTQRTYLYRTILKILRIYHEERSIDIGLYERLINSALLYEKRLYDLSLRELDSAYEMAGKNERHAIALNILGLRADVIIEKNSREILEELEALDFQAEKTLKQLEELMSLKSVQLRMYALCRINYYQRSSDKELQVNGLLSSAAFNLQNRDSLLGYHYYYMTLAGHAYFQGKYKEAFSHYQNLIRHWDAHPDRMVSERLPYMRFLSNIMSSAHACGRFDLLTTILDRFSKLPVQNAEEEAERFQTVMYMELLHIMNTDGFKRLSALTEEISQGLLKYKTKVNKARELAFYHNLSMAWFLIHDWKQALKWNEMIIHQPKTEHRLDLQRAARLFRLILWFEMGKQELLEYELINVERYLRSHKAWFAYEATVVKLFRKLLQAGQDETIDLLATFQDHLLKATMGKTSAALACSSELLFWAKSKLEKRMMRDLINVT